MEQEDNSREDNIDPDRNAVVLSDLVGSDQNDNQTDSMSVTLIEGLIDGETDEYNQEKYALTLLDEESGKNMVAILDANDLAALQSI